MALDLTKLTPIEVGGVRMSGAPAHWSYTTVDASATVVAAGYFNNARKQLQVGDFIFANVDTGGTRTGKIYLVLTVPATGNVTTSAVV